LLEVHWQNESERYTRNTAFSALNRWLGLRKNIRLHKNLAGAKSKGFPLEELREIWPDPRQKLNVYVCCTGLVFYRARATTATFGFCFIGLFYRLDRIPKAEVLGLPERDFLQVGCPSLCRPTNAEEGSMTTLYFYRTRA